MEQSKLNEILEKHRKWLYCEEGGERADLNGADLRGAVLRGAVLRSADLSGADLSGADLRDADLRSADLIDAVLRGAVLRGAVLRGAVLSGAVLSGANLDKKEQIRKGICLTKKMIGYKKCRDDLIVKLEIPKGAIVFSINNSKCRTNIAKVLEISDNKKVAISQQDENFKYKVGKIVRPTSFNCEYNIACAGGIHFFRTRKEAEEY